MDFGLSDEQREFQTLCRRFAAEVIRPVAAKHDAEESTPWEVITAAREWGLHGMEHLQRMANDADGQISVIYAESKFRERERSEAGARGLMQVTPATALEIATKSEGTEFVVHDLFDPDINIRYGSFHLRELLDRYGGNEVAALAAYNAGPSHVDEWGGSSLELDGIGFPETRAYVEEVLDKRQEYGDKYPDDLGLR